MGSGKRSSKLAIRPVQATTAPTPKDPPKRHLPREKPDIDNLPPFIYFTTALSYVILWFVGQLRQWYGQIFDAENLRMYAHYKGYAPLIDGFERMYYRYVFMRIRDAFYRVVTGVPGRTINVLERHSNDYNMTFEYSGKTKEVLNLASYNYLGFGQSEGFCTDRVVESISSCGVTANTSPNEVGYTEALRRTEEQVARFVGKPAAIIMSQGFATNSTTLPALVGRGCLILSDELNHSSLVCGARLSGAEIRSVRHNDTVHLEKVLRDAIVQGQPRTRKPWRKILLVVEGLYSMEGTMPQLARLIELKRKYKFYIYLDEAHSIGALGPRGRGTCDHLGVDPSDIDIMMGTFTKSFGAAGGYIAGSQELIDRLRITNHSSVYGEVMSVPVLQQVASSMAVISGELPDSPVAAAALEDGRRRLIQLAFNSQYFFSELQARGFTLIGDAGSPVVPMMIYHTSKILAFSRECLREGLAVVVVGHPATPLMRDRARFCLSAAHTKADLDFAIEKIDEIGTRLLLKS